MEEQRGTGPELEGAMKAASVAHPGFMTERTGWGVSLQGKGEPRKEMQQRWDNQWQEFLKTLQSPHLAWGGHQLSEATPWEDAKAFLASFEQVAKACRWPRGEWAARLLPALNGEAEQAFRSLEATDREDYWKVKAAILRQEALRVEMQRQHFRHFSCQEVEDPRRIHSQVQELCHQWLKPDRHSKEQILELLILEQFLASLPPELQGWIRAGGPDTCSQAVALVEEFLLSRQVAKTEKWQGSLREDSTGSLEGEKESLDPTQRQNYKDSKQNGDRGINILSSGVKCPSNSNPSLPPEGREVAKAGPSEGLMNLKEAGSSSYHMADWASVQPGQQTMFWQVLQEDGGGMQPLGVRKGSQLKVEISQFGKSELGEAPRTLPELTQGTTPAIADMHEEKCEEKRCWIKMEKSQEGEMLPEETQRVFWNFPRTSETPEQNWESSGQQGKKPVTVENAGHDIMEGLTGADPKTFSLSAEGENPVFSKNERRYSDKPGLVMHTGENPRECPPLGEDIQMKYRLNKPVKILIEGKQPTSSRCGESLHLKDDLLELQNNNAEPKCSEEGKIFRQALMKQQNIHSTMKLYECSICGRPFSGRKELIRHIRLHTGENLHECSACRKKFTSRGDLVRHERIHTGEKPYRCTQCGKRFRQRVHLSNHHRTHTGEKPFQCPQCGKCFSWKRTLLEHQITHMTI